MDRRVARRIVWIVALIVSTLLIGTAGFTLIEGYRPFDAFYMTLITITTVGYQEVRPLSQGGRVFNSFLIFFGVSAMFFAVGAMTQTIIELELQTGYSKRRIRRAIMELKDHYIICGYGRVGRSAAEQLKRSGARFIVVDHNEQRVERAAAAGMLAMRADATRDESLREAGVERARGFISALATDADNLFVILSVKTLNPALTVVTRAAEENSEQKLRRAGADTVFSPYSMAGHRLAQALVTPNVVDLEEPMPRLAGLDARIEQLRIQSGSQLISRRIGDLAWHSAGLIALAIREPGGRTTFSPLPETQIREGDVLVVMGQTANLVNPEIALSPVELK